MFGRATSNRKMNLEAGHATQEQRSRLKAAKEQESHVNKLRVIGLIGGLGVIVPPHAELEREAANGNLQ